MFKTINICITVLIVIFSQAFTAEDLNTKNSVEEFQLLGSEKREIDSFFNNIKNYDTSSLMPILNAAHKGDPVAMYIVGKCCELGRGVPINRDGANLYFTMSASLGYAPALFEVCRMYNNEQEDPLMTFVYLNLTISSGHYELRGFYFRVMEIVSKVAGKRVVQEIERLALCKSSQIVEMQNELKRSENKDYPAVQLMVQNIVSDDCVYNEKYWERFFKSKEAWKKFFGITKN